MSFMGDSRRKIAALLAAHFFNLPETEREEACRDWAETPGYPHLHRCRTLDEAVNRLLPWLENRMAEHEADSLLRDIEAEALETQDEKADLAFSLFNMNPPSS
jgi:hypothetical protein